MRKNKNSIAIIKFDILRGLNENIGLLLVTAFTITIQADRHHLIFNRKGFEKLAKGRLLIFKPLWDLHKKQTALLEFHRTVKLSLLPCKIGISHYHLVQDISYEGVIVSLKYNNLYCYEHKTISLT